MKMCMSFFSFVFILFFFEHCKSGNDEATVEISQGYVQGLQLTSVLGLPYYSFRGIPYAAPPVGELRFKAPEPPTRWNGLRDATTEGAACIQPVTEFHFEESYSENCLFINIFTPKIKVQNKVDLLPVMVWIHGGNFIKGSGNSQKYGPDFFVAEDVVLVTFNYRLGVFGFLNMGTADCQGNAGLKDHVAALRWVAREIHNFGGDPDLVTIFGEGSGAASVNHLVLSPMSQGLFHQAISQSGSSLCRFAYQKSSYENGKKLAEILGCPTTDAQLIVPCLKEADVNDLAIEQLNGAISLEKFEKFVGPFIPTLEQDLGEEIFLPKPPIELIKEGDHMSVPYIFGFNNKDGASFLKDLPIGELDLEKSLIHFLPREIQDLKSQSIDFILNTLETFYFDLDTSKNEELDSFTDFLTDGFFTYDIIRTAYLLDVRKVYLYYFQHVGDFVQSEDICKELNLTGVCHGGELGYMFYSNTTIKAHVNITAGTKDVITLQRMVRLWTNFAKYGEPTVNIKDPLLPLIWDPVTRFSSNYLNINDDFNMTYSNLMKYSTYIWNSIQPAPVRFAMDDLIIIGNNSEDSGKDFWIVGIFEVILILIFVVAVKLYGDHVFNTKRFQYAPV